MPDDVLLAYIDARFCVVNGDTRAVCGSCNTHKVSKTAKAYREEVRTPSPSPPVRVPLTLLISLHNAV